MDLPFGRFVLLIYQFPFYYIKDAQGNICYIVDNKGNLVVSYNYDAWGNTVTKFFFKYGAANNKSSYSITLGTTTYTAQDIDNLNSHYYRGYYLDKETGFYYLTTRYYDPKVGRFISPNENISFNLYIYAYDNPIGIAYSSVTDASNRIISSLALSGLSGNVGYLSGSDCLSVKFPSQNWVSLGIDLTASMAGVFSVLKWTMKNPEFYNFWYSAWGGNRTSSFK